MKNTFLLIDGSSLLVTNYYGTIPKELYGCEDESILRQNLLHDKFGRPTNGLYGMLKQIFVLLVNLKPTHVVIAFDESRDTFRRKLYPQYKAQRKPTPTLLIEQFKSAEEILTQMGFCVLCNPEYEADDLIGSAITAIRNYVYEVDDDNMPLHPEPSKIYLITKDRDYLQLLSDTQDLPIHLFLLQNEQTKADEFNHRYGTTMLLPQKTFYVTADICKQHFGVRPDQITDLKGIVGDTADNIPGVKGVASAATHLLNFYEHLEDIYRAIDITPKKALEILWKTQMSITRSPYNALVKYKDMAYLSKDLATIKRDIEMPAIEAMQLSYNLVSTDEINNLLANYSIQPFGTLTLN